jgi:hypothetical protein
VTWCQVSSCLGTKYVSWHPYGSWKVWHREGVQAGSGLELSRVCIFLYRMRERVTCNWSPSSWLLALSLAWVWTCLTLASLQPSTATGLGDVMGLGFPAAELDSTPPNSVEQALRQSKSHRFQSLTFPLFITLDTLPSSAVLDQGRSGRTLCSLPLPGWKVFCSQRGPGWELKSSLLA